MRQLRRFVLALWLLLGVLATAGPARAHGRPVSRFVVAVGDGELAVRVHLHLESVVTLMEGSHDSVHAGEGAAAVFRHKQRVVEYLAKHLVFSSGDVRCTPREPWGYGDAHGAFYVRVDLEYDCPTPTERLSVRSTLFEGDDQHHLEGEFHFEGRQRVYLLTGIHSAVPIDPSSFREKKPRSAYVPPLDRLAAGTTTAGADATARRETELAASASELTLSTRDRDVASAVDPTDAAPSQGLLARRGVWYASGLLLVLAAGWRVQRGRRKAHAERDRGE